MTVQNSNFLKMLKISEQFPASNVMKTPLKMHSEKALAIFSLFCFNFMALKRRKKEKDLKAQIEI